MTPVRALEIGTEKLRLVGIPGAGNDARKLMAHVLGHTSCGRLDEWTELQQSRFLQFIDDRAAYRPVSQIIGYREFWKHRFKVSTDVLDPRPETETLVELALAGQMPRRILDLGTGSGAIVISLLAEWPMALACGADTSQAALGIAGENARDLGVSSRLELVESDWFTNIDGSFDLIVANPPYLSEREMCRLSADIRLWEPLQALSAGGDGLQAYRQIADKLAEKLEFGGRAIFEVGYKQADAVAHILTDLDLGKVTIHPDMNLHARVVMLERTRP